MTRESVDTDVDAAVDPDVDAAVDPDDVTEVVTVLRDCDRAVALTGAGVSAASGVPTFRGDDGVWATEFDPADFRISRFRSDPAGFWRDRLALHEAMYGDVDPDPNPAHGALADLERPGILDAVLTQNTDGLHDAAGSETVLELHGRNTRVRCQRCGATESAAAARERVRAGIDDVHAGENSSETTTTTGSESGSEATAEIPPTCDCGGRLKPDVVLFGEQLPRETFRRARRLAAASDVLLACGSSLSVEPAASLAVDADSLVVVNLEETAYDDRADRVVRADVTEFLPAVAEHLLE